MTTVGVVRAIVTADTTQLHKAMTDAQRSMHKLGKDMSKVGKSMTMKVTMPLIGVGVAAGKMASDFEFSMTQIETLVGRSAEEVESLKSSVLGLSGVTGRAPKELADAMFFITSAGLDAASATAALEASAKAAAVGLGDTVVVADAVTNAMNGYGMSAEGAAFATDVLAKTVEQGKASAADLAPQFGRLIPMAAELGITFDQVGAGLAFLTRASGDAAMSATQLGGVMKSFLKPSQAAKKVLEEIGVDLHELRAAASTDLLGSLQELRSQLEANGHELSNVFEDIRGLNGALQLTGVATGAAREVFDELADSTGKLDEAFLGVQKTAKFKMAQAMAGLKASMVTLGERVLPVVVPILQKIADWVGKIAEAFGSLSGPTKTAIVIFGMFVAAAGPVLMIAGSLTSALVTLKGAMAMATGAQAGTGLIKMLGKLAPAMIGPHGAALALTAAIGTGLFLAFQKKRAEAKRAQERIDTLREAWVDAELRAGSFKGEIENLRGQLDALNEAAEEAEGVTNGLAAGFGELDLAGVLLAEVVNRDVRGAFNSYISDMDRHADMMRQGKQDYESLTRSITNTVGLEEQNVRAIQKSTVFLGEERAAIIEAIRTRKLSGQQLRDLLRSMDATADAHVDLAKENKKLAKEWLENTDNVVAYVTALDKNTVAEIERLEANGQYVRAATLAIDATKAATEAAEAEAEAVANNRGQYLELDAASALLLGSTEALGSGMEDMAEKVALTTSELAALSAEAAIADRAMLQFAGGEDVEGRMSRTAYWEGQMVLQREERLAAERAIKAEIAAQKAALQAQKDAIQAQKDAIQANINVQEEALENAEAHLAALEAQAEAAKKPVQDLKDRAASEREGFDALRGMWQAQNDLNDAVETQQGLVDEIALVTAGEGDAIDEATKAWEEQKAVVQDLADEIDDLNDQILDAEARKLDLLAKEGEFQRGLTRELNEQRLAYFDIAAQVAELEDRQADLSEGALDAQRGLVDSLKAQQAAVTEVEQALIDLGIVSAADAAQANISAKQAKNLIKLRDEMEDTQAAFEAGEATTLDLIEAQDDYTEAVKDARRPIDGLERATDDLARMEKEAERIGLELAVARDKLTTATDAKAKAEDTAARTSEAVAEIDAELATLEEQLTAVIKAETEARDEANKMKDMSAIQDAELARLNKELEISHWDLVAAQYGVRDAEIALAEAGDKVNDAIDRMTAISPALAAEMIVMSAAARSAYPEFDTMRANLAMLEPRIASAKSAIDGFKDAIAALVREIAILNGTRINQIQVPKVPPLTGQPSGGGGDGLGAAADIVTAVEDVATAVEDVATAMDEVTTAVDGTSILDAHEQAALEDFLTNIDTFEIPSLPVLPPSGFGSLDAGARAPRYQHVPSRPSIFSGGPGGQGLPHLANGGIVSSPTLAMIGERGPEAVVPLRNGGMGDTFVTVNVEGSVTSERDLTEQIRRGLLQAQKSGKQLVL